jgi:hypothetical protein
MDLDKDLHAELGALRNRAKRTCDRVCDTIAEWYQISAAWRNTQAISMAIREEARQVRQQTRLSLARSKERRVLLSGLPSPQESYLPAAADD